MTRCPHRDAELRRALTSLPRPHVGRWCLDCGSWADGQSAWMGRRAHGLTDEEVDRLPVGRHLGASAELEQCPACLGMARLEQHHYAPVSLYGDEAERHPTMRLCRPCHMLWHRLVTPGLCTKKETP